jgi:predicted ATPase
VQKIHKLTNVSRNVADILIATMKKLPEETQQTLMVASCLGTVVPLNILQEFFAETKPEAETKQFDVTSSINSIREDEGREEMFCRFDPTIIQDVLQPAVKAGILRIRSETTSCKWSHDKLHQAAYLLIPEQWRNSVHIRLGKLLWRMSSEFPDQEWMIFMAADQLNKGSIHRSDNKLDVNLARLNLKAAQLSMAKSAFFPAADMARAGVGHLGKDIPWSGHYCLCLDLFNALAEIESIVGGVEASIKAANAVVGNARTLEDRYRAQSIILKLSTSGADRDYKSAMKKTLEVLRSYGVRLPLHPTRIHTTLEGRWLNRNLRVDHSEYFLQLPDMNDKKSLQVMKFLTNHLSLYALLVPEPRLQWLACVNAVKLSVKHGVCQSTSIALLDLAMHYKRENKYHDACKYADLAGKLCDRYKKEPGGLHAQVKVKINCCVLPALRPFHEMMEGLLDTYRTGLLIGDTEFGLAAAMN